MNYEWIDMLIKRIKGDSRVDLTEISKGYLDYVNRKMGIMSEYELTRYLLTELNYEQRCTLKSSELNGFKVRVGDVCYIDFGKAYITEAGFQHFGIVIGYYNSKAFVVPMSSNYKMYLQSFCEKTFPNGKQHLYRLPSISGLTRKSVLFLNDAKFINTSRIIEVKGHISPKSGLFMDIKSRVKTLI